MQKEKRINRKYSSDFKIHVILDMRNNNLGYNEIARKYFSHLKVDSARFIKKWERIYLEEGAAGFMEERRGRKTGGSKNVGRPPKLEKSIEEDLIAENQRLRMEIEYLKKLDALVRQRIERESGKRR